MEEGIGEGLLIVVAVVVGMGIALYIILPKFLPTIWTNVLMASSLIMYNIARMFAAALGG